MLDGLTAVGTTGYAVQRKLLSWVLEREANRDMLWKKTELLNSKYEEGELNDSPINPPGPSLSDQLI
jgi:hypothetical protein